MAKGQPESLLLHKIAAKYVWWKRPDEVTAMPQRVIAQTMSMGDYEGLLLAGRLGDDRLRQVLR